MTKFKDDIINNKKNHFCSLFAGMVPIFVLAHFGHDVLTTLTVPLLPFIRNDFVLDYTRAGLVVSSFSLTYGIGQLPAGWLADRAGARFVELNCDQGEGLDTIWQQGGARKISRIKRNPRGRK